MKSAKKSLRLLMFFLFICGVMFGQASITFGDSLHPVTESGLYENILLNASFEELENGLPKHWEAKDKWKSGKIFASNTAARTGKQGIEIAIDNTDDYWARQTVAVEGGKAYELSAWLKNTVTPPGRGYIKVEFYRDQIDAIGWRGQSENEHIGYLEEMEQVSLQMQMPDDANIAQVYIRLYGPGQALYDDISFHKIEHIPGVNLFTDRTFYYEELTTGKLTAKIWPEDGEYANKSVEVNIYSADTNTSIIHETGLQAVEDFAYTFDPSLLSLQQPYEVKLILKSASGDPLFEDTDTIYRWERPTALREDGVLLVDGEPFFPRMGYHVAVQDYPYVSETVNVVQGIREWDDHDLIEERLDAAVANGLKVFYPLYPELSAMSGPHGFEYVERIVSAFKDHPAIIGWMIQDEPNKFIGKLPNLNQDLAETYKLIRTLDPVKPTYMVVAEPSTVPMLGRYTDIAVTDPYPFPAQRISLVRNHVNNAKKAFEERPVFNVLQSFMLPDRPRYSYLPNITELRNMAYQSILSGAQGLGYYSFIDPGWNLMESTLYPGLIEFTERELPHVEDIVLHGTQINSYEGETVEWKLWEKADQLYLIAVNLEASAQAISVPLPNDRYHVQQIAPEDAELNIFSNELMVDLTAFESKLYILSAQTQIQDLINLIDQLDNDGYFTSNNVVSSLKDKLDSAQSFEENNELNIAFKHLRHFQQLLDQYYTDNDVSEVAYNQLLEQAILLLRSWTESFLKLQITLPNTAAIAGEQYPVQVTFTNTGTIDIKNLTLQMNMPELATPYTKTKSLLGVAESLTETFLIELPDAMTAGNHSISLNSMFDYGELDIDYNRDKRILVESPIQAELTTKEINVKENGIYHVSLKVKNKSSHSIDIDLSSTLPQHIIWTMPNIVSLAVGGEVIVDGELEITEEVSDGQYVVTIDVEAYGNVVQQLSFKIMLDRNLIENPSFEQTTNGTRATNWEATQNWKTSGTSVTTEEKKTGLTSLKLDSGTTNDNYLVAQNIKVKPGAMYDFSVWLKSQLGDGGKAEMKVEFYKDVTGSAAAKGQIFSDPLSSYADWEQVSMQVLVPDDANLLRIYLRVYGPGVAYYDDASLRLMPTIVEPEKINLLKNEGFENVSSGVPWSWKISSSWTSGNISVSAEAARTGSLGLKLLATTTANYSVRQEAIAVSAGEMYELSAWLKSEISAGGSARMKIEFYDSAGIKGEVWSDPFSSYEQWEEVTIVTEAPAGSTFARVFLRIFGPGSAYFDDVSFHLL